MRIAGLDEVGRGALAGPLVAAGIVLNSKFKLQITNQKLDDSKKLNSKQREKLCGLILKSDAVVQVETISARQINNKGIGWANKEIFRRLIKRIEADKYIVDGNLKLGRILGKSQKVKSVIRADCSRKCVMAAAIVAKVFRDEQMNKLHDEHPNYGWRINKGYGTKSHVLAIKERGKTRYHRDVFVTTAMRKII